MRWMSVIVLIALAAGCAGPSSRDESDALRRSEAKRELERECRIAAQTGRYDPDCPQPQPQRQPSGPALPPPPDVRLPGG